jgi:hypothetical protein
MRSMPPLLGNNRFASLEVENIIDNSTDTTEPLVKLTTESPTKRTPRCKWEKRLPNELVLASTPGDKSLNL